MVSLTIPEGNLVTFRVRPLKDDPANPGQLIEAPVAQIVGPPTVTSDTPLLVSVSYDDASQLRGSLTYRGSGTAKVTVTVRPLGAPADGSGDISNVYDVTLAPNPVSGVDLEIGPPTPIPTP